MSAELSRLRAKTMYAAHYRSPAPLKTRRRVWHRRKETGTKQMKLDCTISNTSNMNFVGASAAVTTTIRYINVRENAAGALSAP
jgi:hypothetical protein